MKANSRLTLQWRLLGGFLFSAFFTGFSVMIGYYSLNQIQSNMKITTENIGKNIEQQNAVIRQLMSLRSLVTHISSAKNAAELSEKEKEIGLLKDSWNTQLRQIIGNLEKLGQHKHSHIQALRELFELRKSNVVMLVEVTKIAHNILNDPKFSSAAQIDEAISGIKTHFGKMIALTEAAMKTVRAALSLRSYCSELNLLVKDALLSTDAAIAGYIGSETATMFANIYAEAENLPENEDTLRLKETLAELEKIVGNTLKKKKESLENPGIHTSESELSELWEKSDIKFRETVQLAMRIVDHSEFDSSMQIEESAVQIRRDLDQTSVTSVSAVSVIKAAMSLRDYCNELNAKVKDALVATDIESADRAKSEISKLFAGTRKELLELPKDEKTVKLSEMLDTLAPLTESMFVAVRKVVYANEALSKTTEKIQSDMEIVERVMVIDAARNMKYKADRTLEDTQNFADKWHSYQILIGLSSVLAAIAVGYITSKKMNKTIRSITAGMSESVNQMASVSTQVYCVNNQLVDGASRQQISIEKTSAAVRDFLNLTRKNENTASRVNAMMKKNSQVVDDSAVSMAELNHSIQEISSASSETRKIIHSIDEIAFKTRLLSLNASIEAARAGEAGTGFAVVAEEVGNLAMQSTEAAQTTASLIENIIGKIQEQRQMVEKTDRHFSQISLSVADVDNLVKDMMMALNEQSEGVTQINEAVGEVEEVIRQNAANAEKSVAVFGELNRQTERMLSYIRILRGLEEQRMFQKYIRIPQAVSGTFYLTRGYEKFVSKNISMGGVLISTDNPLTIGDIGKIELNFDNHTTIMLKAQVVRMAEQMNNNGKYVFAMKFIKPDSKTGKLLNKIISSFLRFAETERVCSDLMNVS